MTEEDIKEIIDYQFELTLKEKGMRKSDLSKYEELQWKFDIAVKLIIEL
jgi:hypothetical protein